MLSEEEIYERLMEAIFDQRLAPGTKLGEDRLAAIFGVSRARIRRVLPRLAHEGVAQMEPNRGAFVAEPSVAMAREVLEARRVIEPAIARAVVRFARREEAIERLRAHVSAEEQARASNDVRSTVRLSGEFHMLLAQIAGNSLLTQTLRELTSLTCLIIALYGKPSASHCLLDEHTSIVDAIEAGDEVRVAELMTSHLHHVQAGLRLTRVGIVQDLETALTIGEHLDQAST